MYIYIYIYIYIIGEILHHPGHDDSYSHRARFRVVVHDFMKCSWFATAGGIF